MNPVKRSALWAVIAALFALSSVSFSSTPVTVVPEDGSVAVTQWLITGPLPSTSVATPPPDGPKRLGYDRDYLTAIGGETAAKIAEGTKITVDGVSYVFKPWSWKKPYVDIREPYGSRSEVCAYLYAEIESATSREVIIHAGSNDAGKMWVGGKLVVAYPKDRSARPMQHVVTVKIEKGRTPILMKIDQAGGGWGAYFTVFTPKAHKKHLRDTFPRTLGIGSDVEFPRVGDKLKLTIYNVAARGELGVKYTWTMTDNEKVIPIKGDGPTNELTIPDGKARRIVVSVSAKHPVDGIAEGEANIFASTLAANFFAPKKAPDHIMLSLDVAGDTDRRVTWRTDVAASGTVAQLVKCSKKKINWSTAKAKTIKGTSVTHESNTSDARFHDVVFSGLDQGSKYAYRIGDGTADGWSKTYKFDVPKTDGEVTIAIIGDTRSQMDIWRQVIEATAKHKPAFIAHTGDIVARGSNMNHWNRWFYEAKDILPEIPMMPSAGNHEGQAPEYFLSFSLPRNAPAGEKEQWYSFDFGPTHWIAPNSNYKQTEQVAWMEKDLAANDKPWSFATYHAPLYSGHPSRGDGDISQRKRWGPVFDKYGVAVGWQGHDHYYTRTKSIKAEKIVPDNEGTVYVVSGGGGAPLYDFKPNNWIVKGEKVHHYIIMTATKKTAKFTAYRLDGTVLDRFELKK
jgi:acid phosphatase type 7